MPNKMASSPEDDLWESLPDHLLLSILKYLRAQDLSQSCQVCKQWNRVSNDEFLWKDLFYNNWKIDRSLPMTPGASSWYTEYKRLLYHVPCYATEVLAEHKDEVLHVSFSHNGKYFATSSKDGYVKVWSTTYPCSVQYYEDMKAYTWKYTQYTQFNSSDTLLLVSGVHFGSHSTSGEIAVFNITDGFQLQCRVQNKPYDIFGSWYNDSHLLSGNLHWLGNFSSCSILWLNKASQELDSEWENVVMRLFRFLNTNASSIRTIFVTPCPETEVIEIESTSSKQCGQRKRKVSDSDLSQKLTKRNASDSESEENYLELKKHVSFNTDMSEPSAAVSCEFMSKDSETDHKKVTQVQRQSSMDLLSSETCDLQLGESDTSHNSNEQNEANYNSVVNTLFEQEKDNKEGNISEGGDSRYLTSEDCLQQNSPAFKTVCEATSHKSKEEKDKYLIFTTGSMTYTPHQIGIKRIKHSDAIGRLDKLSRERWIREQQLKLRHQLSLEKSTHDAHGDQQNDSDTSSDSDNIFPAENEEAAENRHPNHHHHHYHHHEDDDVEFDDEVNRMDPIDHLIEMNGHIIGMQLSPDHRYLYVNTRDWPTNYQIDDPLEPPPLAQQIEIHVIDLLNINDMGVMHRAHKAYTASDECFFIFLDVCKDYVASGAEDKFGYLWERHYRALLNRYPHNDVVNSVAFQPNDPETMVTVSDDFRVKVWRSKSRCKELGINTSELTCSERFAQCSSKSIVKSTTDQSKKEEQPNVGAVAVQLKVVQAVEKAVQQE